MVESIEAFVAKLQEEGVDAGRQAAERLRAEARQQAEEIVRQARAEAESIVAGAEAQARSILQKAGTELKLAARDAVLRLREVIQTAVEAVLAKAAQQRLADTDFVSALLHDLCLEYAKADVERRGTVRINVPPEQMDKLTDWALAEICRKAEARGLSIDLKGRLAQAGFEYNISGATVEVTVSSVVEVLSDLVGPKLAEVLNEAIAADAE